MRFGSVEAKVSAGYHIQLAKDPSLTTMTAFPRRLATLAGFLLAFSAPVPAQPLSLLSFNVEHLM
jgi:hypothetical protein